MSQRNNGLANFKRRLAKVPAAIRQEVDAADEKSAKEWVAAAKSAAPVDPDGGGTLRDSIRHERSDTGGQVIRAGGATTRRKSATGREYDYARAMEFGAIDESGRRTHANPFFWTTYRMLRRRIISRRSRAFGKAFKVFNQ